MKAVYFGKYRHDPEAECNYTVDFAKDYCGKNGYEFVGEYKDFDGKREKSEAYKQLMKDCESGVVDLIIIKNTRVLGRDMPQLIKILRKLKRMNVGVYSLSHGMDLTKIDFLEKI